MYANVADVTTVTCTCFIYTSKASLTSDSKTPHYSSADLDSHALSHRRLSLYDRWLQASDQELKQISCSMFNGPFPQQFLNFFAAEVKRLQASQILSYLLCACVFPTLIIKSTVKAKITNVSRYNPGFYLREKKNPLYYGALLHRFYNEFCRNLSRATDLFQRMPTK